MGPADTVVGLLAKSSQEWGERPAICSPGCPGLSYGELFREVCLVAERLRSRGVQRHSRVAMALPAGMENLVATLGVMGAAVAMPLDPALRQAEHESRLRRLKADFLALAQGDSTPARAAAESAGVPVIELPGAGAGRCGDLGLRETEAESTAGQPGSLAAVMLTSGTTGEPKRVPLTQANLCASARFSALSMELQERDLLLASVPVHHIAGIGVMLAALSAGSGICCVRPAPASQFLEWMREVDPTWIFAVPTVLRELVKRAGNTETAVRNGRLRFIRSGSAPVPASLMEESERVLGAPVIEVYGMTEAAPLIACSPLPPAVRKAGSVGLPAGPEVRIRTENGVAQVPGAQGEIQVRGRNLMSGYEDDAEENLRAFDDGWFRTGDVGFLDNDGYLHIAGRLREVINRGGQKVFPREVEDALLGHRAVVEACAFGLASERLGEEVAAAVVLKDGVSVTPRELRLHCARRLAEYKVPVRIVHVAEIPKGAGGKPARAALIAQLRMGGGLRAGMERTEPRPPVTPIEKRLARIWRDVLKTGEVASVHDDFFDLGGDSFGAAVLLAAVQAELGVPGEQLEKIDFLESPTIAGMATALAGLEERAGGVVRRGLPVVTLQGQGLGSPFFFVPWVSEDPFYVMDLARRLGREQPFHVMRDPTRVELRRRYTIESVAAKFVEAARTLCPGGPFRLCGHCVGGIVAYEMARQLRAAGEEVEALILLDTPRPGYPHPLRHWRRFLIAPAWHLGSLLRGGRGLRGWGQDIQSIGAHFWRVAQGSWERSFGGRRAMEYPGAEQDLYSANVRAARMYSPGNYAGRVVHFIAEDHDQTGSPLDRRAGWEELVQGSYEVQIMQGSHAGILAEPQVGELAGRMKRLVEAAGG